jgi:hypothetical protein
MVANWRQVTTESRAKPVDLPPGVATSTSKFAGSDPAERFVEISATITWRSFRL